MTKRRPTRPCKQCGRGSRSATGFCATHRPADAIAAVHHAPGGLVSFGGFTLTTSQARRLADALHDICDEIEGSS